MSIFISGRAVKMFPEATAIKFPVSCTKQLLEEELLSMYDELRWPLLRYATSFGLTLQDGEDVIQETFFALFRHLQQHKSRENLRSWLFRVTHNLSLRQRRNYKTDHRIEEENHLLSISDPNPDPVEALLFQERQQRLRRVMMALPDNHRACLGLRAEGLRYREIAQVLGISLGSVAGLLDSSLERLKRADEV